MATNPDNSFEPAPISSASFRRSVLSRISLGHVIMVVAAILALVFNLAVLRSDEATNQVAIAATDIAAGTTLTPSHFETAAVPADDLLTTRLIVATDIESVMGRLTTRAISAGEPILESDLIIVEDREGLRAMSLPIDQSRAVGGRLSPGDSVDVILVLDGVATYIATAVAVVDVPSSETNALGARTGYAPTLAVDATQALRIAAALDIGEVHLVRSTGSAPPDLQQAVAVEDGNVTETGASG